MRILTSVALETERANVAHVDKPPSHEFGQLVLNIETLPMGYL